MPNSIETFWSPGPVALAVRATPGEVFSEADWKEDLRQRLNELGEQMDDPVTFLQQEWMNRVGGDLVGLQSPGDVVDHPEFEAELERHGLEVEWPIKASLMLEPGTEPPDLETWVMEMLPSLRD